MEESYAILLVKIVIKQAPTTSYQISILAKISSKEFVEKIPHIMHDMWTNRISPIELSKKYTVTLEFVQYFMSFSRECMNKLQRRNISVDSLKQFCLNEGLPNSSTDVLIKTFQTYENFWHDMIVFTNVQDSIAELRMIRAENQEIKETVKEILKYMKKTTDTSNHSFFQ